MLHQEAFEYNNRHFSQNTNIVNSARFCFLNFQSSIPHSRKLTIYICNMFQLICLLPHIRLCLKQ